MVAGRIRIKRLAFGGWASDTRERTLLVRQTHRSAGVTPPPATIAVVDDDPCILQLLELQLMDAGF